MKYQPFQERIIKIVRFLYARENLFILKYLTIKEI
jgi:hypothetical protein